jgi:hypothetical protein
MIIKEKLVAATVRRHGLLEERVGLRDARPQVPMDGGVAKPRRRGTLDSPYQMLLSSDYIQAANDHRRADLMFEAAGAGRELHRPP